MFLRLDPSCRPAREAIDEPDEFDAEVIQVHTLKFEKSRHPIDELLERHSRQLMVQRVVGWCLRYPSNLRARTKKERLLPGELTAAERLEPPIMGPLPVHRLPPYTSVMATPESITSAHCSLRWANEVEDSKSGGSAYSPVSPYDPSTWRSPRA